MTEPKIESNLRELKSKFQVLEGLCLMLEGLCLITMDEPGDEIKARRKDLKKLQALVAKRLKKH